jgi:hypothetical protein
MLRRFRAIGLEVEYVGDFGLGYYRRIPALHKLEKAQTQWLLRHPVSALTSCAGVALRKSAAPVHRSPVREAYDPAVVPRSHQTRTPSMRKYLRTGFLR